MLQRLRRFGASFFIANLAQIHRQPAFPLLTRQWLEPIFGRMSEPCLDCCQKVIFQLHHRAAQRIHELTVPFLSPSIERLGIRKHEVPGFGCVQHQQVLRFVWPGEQDDEHGRVAGEADIGEDVQQGGGGEPDFPRGGFDDRLIEAMQ